MTHLPMFIQTIGILPGKQDSCCCPLGALENEPTSEKLIDSIDRGIVGELIECIVGCQILSNFGIFGLGTNDLANIPVVGNLLRLCAFFTWLPGRNIPNRWPVTIILIYTNKML
jgi:hypothetical protein